MMRKKKENKLEELGAELKKRTPRKRADYVDGMQAEADECLKEEQQREEAQRKEAEKILDDMEQFADKCQKEDSLKYLSNPDKWREVQDVNDEFIHKALFAGPITAHQYVTGKTKVDGADPAIKRKMPPKREPLAKWEIDTGGRHTIPYGLRYDMTFDEAFDLLEKGHAIRRAAWPSFQFIWKPKPWKLREGCEASRNDPVLKWAISLAPADTYVDPCYFTFRLLPKDGGGLQGTILPCYCWSLYDQKAEDWEELYRPGMYDSCKEEPKEEDKPMFDCDLPFGSETV